MLGNIGKAIIRIATTREFFYYESHVIEHRQKAEELQWRIRTMHPHNAMQLQHMLDTLASEPPFDCP